VKLNLIDFKNTYSVLQYAKVGIDYLLKNPKSDTQVSRGVFIA
jgi:hypothetical protein